MIEVDVFWSFAIGASCACACAKQLSKLDNAFGNKYFGYTVFLLSCVFSPSGSYLLIAYPGWESMFLLNRQIINDYPILITIFNSTNTLLGIIGFYFVHKMVRYNKINGILYCNLYWIVPYVIMFAILGCGYDRFLFPYKYDDYHKDYNDHPQLYLFFQCDVFYTLLLMGIILLPMIYYPVFKWIKLTKKELKQRRNFVLKWIYICIIIVIICYMIFIHGIIGNDAEKQSFYNDKRIEFAGIYAPIIGFLVFMHSLFILALIPVFFIGSKSHITTNTVQKKKKKKKK